MELKWSDVFQRKIRVGDWSEVGTPTWTLVREAIQAGKREEALELLDYVSNEVKVMHDTEHSLAEAASAYIADKMGEEELERFWRELMENPVIPSFLSAQTLEDAIRQTAECQRGHFGAVSVTEEPDRYIVTYRPCGSLVRLWQTRDVGKTRKPHPWSWNEAGVPYWCTHCNVFFETVPAERTGYPDRVTFPPATPDEPCVHYYYKDRDDIPEEYFARIGRTKPKG
jgi:hypothetical protein